MAGVEEVSVKAVVVMAEIEVVLAEPRKRSAGRGPFLFVVAPLGGVRSCAPTSRATPWRREAVCPASDEAPGMM